MDPNRSEQVRASPNFKSSKNSQMHEESCKMYQSILLCLSMRYGSTTGIIGANLKICSPIITATHACLARMPGLTQIHKRTTDQTNLLMIGIPNPRLQRASTEPKTLEKDLAAVHDVVDVDESDHTIFHYLTMSSKLVQSVQSKLADISKLLLQPHSIDIRAHLCIGGPTGA